MLSFVFATTTSFVSLALATTVSLWSLAVCITWSFFSLAHRTPSLALVVIASFLALISFYSDWTPQWWHWVLIRDFQPGSLNKNML